MVEESYGEFVVNRVRDIINEVTVPLPVATDDDLEMVRFPETLVWGDPERTSLIEGEVYDDWQEHLPDLVGRMAKEGVLLVLSALPDVGIPIEDPLFVLIADLCASFYARGYLIGLLDGPDGSPSDEKMETYLAAVQEDVDRQVAQMEIIMDNETGDNE